MDIEILQTSIMAVAAIVSPAAIAWLKQPSWHTVVKTGTPVVVSLAIAVWYAVSTEALQGLGFLAAFLVVYGIQQISYRTILKALSSFLEAKTGPGSRGNHEAE